jgi:hypothetical protein
VQVGNGIQVVVVDHLAFRGRERVDLVGAAGTVGQEHRPVGRDGVQPWDADVGAGHRAVDRRLPDQRELRARHRTVAGVHPGHESAALLHLHEVGGAAGAVGHSLHGAHRSACHVGDPAGELSFVHRDLPGRGAIFTAVDR